MRAADARVRRGVFLALLAATAAAPPVAADDARQARRVAEQAMDRYLRAALASEHSATGVSFAPRGAPDLDTSQRDWLRQREAQCDDSTGYPGAPKPDPEVDRCRADMTRERTHWLWRTYLLHADATRPDLPEPPLP